MAITDYSSVHFGDEDNDKNNRQQTFLTDKNPIKRYDNKDYGEI